MTDLSQKPLPAFSLSWLKTPWTISIIVPILVLILDTANIGPFMGIATRAFGGTLPYILFAVLLIASLKAAGAEAAISEAFKGKEVRMIFLAALFGGLAPFCSCEVIPFIAGLLALGTPLSAVMAFWLSSPLIDPPTLLITAAALGWPFAIGKAVAAVALGLFGGFAMLALMRTPVFASPLKEYKPAGCCGVSPDHRQTGLEILGRATKTRIVQGRIRFQCAVPDQMAGIGLCFGGCAYFLCARQHDRSGRRRRWRSACHIGSACRHACLSELLCCATHAVGPDGTGYEFRRSHELHDCRCCKFHPCHGRRMVAGKGKGLCRLYPAWHQRRGYLRVDLPDCCLITLFRSARIGNFCPAR